MHKYMSDLGLSPVARTRVDIRPLPGPSKFDGLHRKPQLGRGEVPAVSRATCPRNKLEAISAARAAFAKCQFDAQSCDLGLKRLRAYRKEWDEDRGVWKDRPRHDDASHGADAFLTFACSGYRPPVRLILKKPDLRWVV